MLIAPDEEITSWRLSPSGLMRARHFSESKVLSNVSAIWSSAERKAVETAQCLSNRSALKIQIDPRLGENDRSATGFLPPEDFERAADAFFADPDQSINGWERALDAQKRITSALRDITTTHPGGDLAIVSHGAVGTLLWCHLMGFPISRAYDQHSQGHYWTAPLSDLRPRSSWRSIGSF